MSLFTALGSGASALSAAQTAIQITGQNIGNAGNVDYTRQRVNLAPRVPVQSNGLHIGAGVDVTRIERVLDRQLDAELRNAHSALGRLDVRHRALERLEGVLNELDGTGLSKALGQFFDAAENLASQPQDLTARRLFLSAAESLAATFQVADEQLTELRGDLDAQLRNAAGEVNRLSAGIAELNARILLAEKGVVSNGGANDLRNQRDMLLRQLSSLVEIRAQENDQGVVNVSVGSDFLVEGATPVAVLVETRVEDNLSLAELRLERGGKLFQPSGGSIRGLLDARDEDVPQVISELADLAEGVIRHVNRVHVGGEGLVGYSEVTAEQAVSSPVAPLDGVGLAFAPRNGSFDLRVTNSITGLVKTFGIDVDLDNLDGDDTTLQTLVDSINDALAADFPSVTASITAGGKLRLASSDPDVTFRFADDSSGVLTALGVGTFFSGTSARDIGVSRDLLEDPRLVATGLGDGPADSRNVQAISDLRGAPLLANDSSSFEEFYTGMVGVVGVKTQEAGDQLSTQEVLTAHAENRRAAVSGVNLDEESIELIRHQRVFQGAARYINVVDALLETLVSLI